MLGIASKVICVQCDDSLTQMTVLKTGNLIKIGIPDVGSDQLTGKPNNVRRWLSQIEAALDHVDEGVLIIHRSDLEMNLNSLNGLLSVSKKNVWTIDATTLAAWTGIKFHYCDWMLGGTKQELLNYIPDPKKITFQSIFGSNTFSRYEFGFEFNEIRRSEQIILSKILTKNEFEALSGNDVNPHKQIKRRSDIKILSTKKHVIRFKGRAFNYRPMLFRMRPTNQNFFDWLEWNIMASIYTLYFPNSRKITWKYLRGKL
jgi:hypothetical protein